MERQRGQQQRRRPPWRRRRIRGRRSEIPYAERQAGISCLSGRFSCRLLRHRSDAAARLGFSDAYSDTKFKLPASAQEQELAKFSSVALRTTEETWGRICSIRQKVHSSEMVLYSGSTRTACGYGQAAMGPFYCPSDHKLYVDSLSIKTCRENWAAEETSL